MYNESEISPRRKMLIDKVRLRMEEWTRGEDTDFLLENDKPFYPIVTYIDEYLDEAARKVLAMLPHHRLDKVAVDFDLTNFHVENGIGYIPLPSNFIKLFGIQMKCWSRALSETLKVTEDEYKIQQHRHSRGLQDKPQVAVAFGNVEIYSCRDNDDEESVLMAKYIPIKKAEDLPEELDEFVTIVCASIVEKVFGDYNQAKVLDDEINVMLQLSNV